VRSLYVRSLTYVSLSNSHRETHQRLQRGLLTHIERPDDAQTRIRQEKKKDLVKKLTHACNDTSLRMQRDLITQNAHPAGTAGIENYKCIKRPTNAYKDKYKRI